MNEMSTVAYLRQELRFSVPEWSQLTEKDKADLKTWAAEEMSILGIPVKG